jgi:hypothetical protein
MVRIAIGALPAATCFYFKRNSAAIDAMRQMLWSEQIFRLEEARRGKSSLQLLAK